MFRIPGLKSGLKTLREVDLNAIRLSAETPLHLAVIGDNGTGKSTLVSQLLSGPGAYCPSGLWPVSEHRLDEDIRIQPHTIVLFLLDAACKVHLKEHKVLSKLFSCGVPVIICYNKTDLSHNQQELRNEALGWQGAEVVGITAIDHKSLVERLVPVMLRAGKGREVTLARNIPMLREAVSRRLINDTSFINGAYSLATGLAEINVLLNIPLNMADMVVLTKNQALMAYKIALALGLSSDWHVTIPKLATVVGSAFLWRQLARQLVGLVPAYGIIPKVAVSYAGTYTVGYAVYQWCAHGEKISTQNLKALYAEAMGKGRQLAQSLATRGNSAQIAASRKLRRLLAPA